MILRARVVVTMDGPPIGNGAVAVEGERIVDVGAFEEISARRSGEIVDLGEQALLPGLINTHCHLDYTRLRGRIPPPKIFTDWIRAIIAEKEKLSSQDYLESINVGFAEAKSFGTATIANLTGFPDLIAQIRPLIRTWWFPELIDIRSPVDFDRVRPAGATRWGLAAHAPFTASADLYRQCEEIARCENLLLTTHLAESRDEMEMFSDSRGPLFDFLSEIGRDNSDLHGTTPLQHVSAFCELDESWLLVHLNEITASDVTALRQRSSLPNVVHCPRSHAYFRHSPFQFRTLLELGFNICLGTDSLASNDDLNLFAEMRTFQRNEPSTPPGNILEMVTLNAARALGQSDLIGQIAPGFLADLIAVPCAGSTNAFEEIVAFDGAVKWMLIGGKNADPVT